MKKSYLTIFLLGILLLNKIALGQQQAQANEEQDEIFTRYHGSELWIPGNVKSFTCTTYEYKENFGDPVKGDMTMLISKSQTTDGYIVKQTFYKDANIGSYYPYNSYKFANDGSLSELNLYSSEGKLKYKIKYNYNDNTVSRSVYYGDGSLFFTDYMNLSPYYKTITECYTYKSDGSRQIKFTYFYSAVGNRLFKKVNAPPGVSYDEYDCNGKDDRTHEHSYSSAFNDGSNPYIYDLYYSYEYDLKGNWIKKITYISNQKNPQKKGIYITERSIQYE